MSQIYCPSCHSSQEAGSHFCGNCGTRISAPASPQQPYAATAYGPQHAQPNAGQYAGDHSQSGLGAPAYAAANPVAPGYGTPHYGATLQGGPQQIPGGLPGMIRAGFGVRLLAYLIDFLILLVLRLILVAIGLKGLVPALILNALYFVGCWAALSATPGKLALGMTIVSADGKPLSFGGAFLRYVGYNLSYLFLGIGFLMIAFDDQKRGLHDRIAGTQVLRKA